MRSGDCRSGRVRPQWRLVAAACLMASLLPVTSAGAADEPAAASEPASNTEDPAGGVQVVRYAGSDRYAMSIEVAQALVDAEGGSSEWVVLVSGESWADAAAAGPLAASLGAPVVLVPSGGLQALSARIEFAELLRSAGVRRVMIVGSGIVLPDHKQSVLYGLGMLPRDVERLHGTDPVATSIAVAERISAPAELGELDRTVVIASDRSVADAVAVGPLAAAGPFPLLFTAPDALDPRIAAYLTEYEIAHVVLVGGTAAITPAVQHAIESAGVTVTRLAGRDRIDTARLAADLFDQHTADDPACYAGPFGMGLAATQQPEGALTAGALLAQQCAPLRYTEPDRLPADLRNTLFLVSSHPEGARVLAFAGEAQVPDEIVRPSVPPALVAYSSGWPQGHLRHGQAAVAIVDELGQRRLYPVGTTLNSGYLGDVFAWSPDGRFLAYVDAYHDRPQLMVIDTVGDEVVEASLEAPNVLFSGWHRPVWSPDSTRLAFSAFPGDASTLASWDMGGDRGPYIYPTAEMYAFDTQTGETARLTHNATSDEPHAWSPDGGSIAFTQAETPIGHFAIVWYSTSLRVLELATGSVTELFDRANAYPDVTWAPDGSHMAFTGYGEPSDESEWYLERRVYLARSDGSAIEELTTGGNWGGIVGWTADSAKVHYRSHAPFHWHASGSTQRQVRNVESGEDTVLENPDPAETGRLLPVRLSSYSPWIRGLPYGKRQQAEIIDSESLVVYSEADSQGRVILDFADLAAGTDISCTVMWADSGIRGSCPHWRDF